MYIVLKIKRLLQTISQRRVKINISLEPKDCVENVTFCIEGPALDYSCLLKFAHARM